MLHTTPLAVAHRTQLVLFRDWEDALPGSANDACGWNANPDDPGLVRAMDRRALWSRVAELLTRERVSWRAAAAPALRAIADCYAGNERTQRKVVHELARFVRYAEGCGVEWVDELSGEHVEAFVWWASKRHGRYSDVKSATAANRQAFVRRFMEQLADMGLWSGGDIVGKPISRDLGDGSRVLTEAELRRVQVHADTGLFRTRRALLVVFAEAGADAAETAQVALDDIDLVAGTVLLRGGYQRINPLSTWGRTTTLTLLANDVLPSGEPLCVSRGLALDRAAHSVTVRLREVLADAGLHGVPGVTARSIRLTAAAEVLASAGIEAAAKFLGNNSLDTTAKALGHDWWAK